MKNAKTLLENFSRYEFAADGTAKNKATGTAIAIEANGSMRLTDNDGARKRVYQSDVIKEVAAPGSTSPIASTAVKQTKNSATVDLSEDDETSSKLLVQTSKKSKAEKQAIVSAKLKEGQEKRAKDRSKKTDKEPHITNETGKRKLSLVDVAEIKRRIEDGDKNKDIALDYSVHSSTISDIKGGRLYGSVAAATA